MANAAHTTPIEATTPVFTPSRITNCFSRLIDAMASLIDAERDIEGVDIWDPAYRSWLTDAEHAHEVVTSLLRIIIEAHPLRAVDLPLIQLSSAIHLLMGSENSHELHHAMRIIQHPQFDFSTDHGVMDWHIQEMIVTAQDRAMELASLNPSQSYNEPDPELESVTDIWPEPLAA